MLTELLGKALEKLTVGCTVSEYTQAEAGYFTSLPDELILQIATCAGEVAPNEFVVKHPADDVYSDTLFTNGKLAPKQVWEAKWREALFIRSNMVKVCRKFRRITTPILYSSYFATEGFYLLRFVSEIQSNPHLGEHMRRIDILFGRFHLVASAETAIPELVRLCPNLQILSIPIPLDPSILPISLKSLHIKSFLPAQHHLRMAEWSVVEMLRRLKHLERLILRTNLSPSISSCLNLVDYDKNDSSILSHPSLQTVFFEGSISDVLLEIIISPENYIQSIQFGKLDQAPEVIFSKILPRAKYLTYLSFPDSWKINIPLNLSIPTLRHIHRITPTKKDELSYTS